MKVQKVVIYYKIKGNYIRMLSIFMQSLIKVIEPISILSSQWKDHLWEKSKEE